MTSEGYYRWRIHHIFDQVVRCLLLEPRRVFALENIFFLRMYWEREPRRHEVLRRLFASGQLELTGSGITTPDTNLPHAEAILRDYQIGHAWLQRNQIPTVPTVAYLPDDFGAAPTTPALLRAIGYARAGITRIDGMYFIGSHTERKRTFPLPGSSAELLQKTLSTLDFVWRSPDGSEVLTHWNAFNYFQGDMLAHFGVIRWMGIVFGVPWRTQRHIARRIRRFVEHLGPLARTPYLFCPMGCDFNGPVRDLTGLLDRYNDRFFPQTGVWAVCAGLEDYLALIDEHRDQLPVVELDPNPYWIGVAPEGVVVLELVSGQDRHRYFPYYRVEVAKGDVSSSTDFDVLDLSTYDDVVGAKSESVIAWASGDQVMVRGYQPNTQIGSKSLYPIYDAVSLSPATLGESVSNIELVALRSNRALLTYEVQSGVDTVIEVALIDLDTGELLGRAGAIPGARPHLVHGDFGTYLGYLRSPTTQEPLASDAAVTPGYAEVVFDAP